MSSELPKTSSTLSFSTSPEEKTKQALREILEQENGNKAVEILNIIVYFASENIHCGIFSKIMNDEELKGSIKLLKEYSLVTLDAKENVCINKFVQTVIKDTMEEQKKEEVLKQALHMLSKELNSDIVDHALSVWSYASEYPNLIKESGRLSSQVVDELREQYRYKEGDSFGCKALRLLQETLGENHRETLLLQWGIGILLEKRGNYKKAVEILQPLIEKDEILEQNEILSIKVSVALYLTKLTQYDESLSLYQNILNNKKISEINPKILFDAWLGQVEIHRILANYKEAIEILDDLLKRRVETLGMNINDKLKVKLIMAKNFIQQSKYDKALIFLRDIYYEGTDILGKNHMDTLIIKLDIARVFQFQDKYEEALVILQEVANKFEQALGKRHQNTLLALIDIGKIFHLRKENDKALEIYQKVYLIQSETFGPTSDIAIIGLINIAAIHFEQCNFIEAVKVINEVYQGFIENYGLSHSKTVGIKRAVETYERHFNESIVPSFLDGNLNHIKTLIQNGLDINKCDGNEETLMHYAARHGHIHVVKFLLEKGAIYNIKNKEGKTPAQLSGKIEIRNLFNAVAKLFQCVKEEDEQGVRDVIKERAIINAKEDDFTPLYWAAKNNHYNIINILLESGADVTQVKGITSFHIAALKGKGYI